MAKPGDGRNWAPSRGPSKGRTEWLNRMSIVPIAPLHQPDLKSHELIRFHCDSDLSALAALRIDFASPAHQLPCRDPVRATSRALAPQEGILRC
jgi:hypothetical protein